MHPFCLQEAVYIICNATFSYIFFPFYTHSNQNRIVIMLGVKGFVLYDHSPAENIKSTWLIHQLTDDKDSCIPQQLMGPSQWRALKSRENWGLFIARVYCTNFDCQFFQGPMCMEYLRKPLSSRNEMFLSCPRYHFHSTHEEKSHRKLLEKEIEKAIISNLDAGNK